MGNNIDKLDATLLQYAPLDEEIVSNLYFIHDAYRYMDLITLACEGIIRPSQCESRGRISSLEDFGMILKSSGKKLGRQSTFAKILIATGNLEILIGKMENVWAYEIENSLVKPMQKCLCDDSDELTLKRDQIMKIRIQLKDAKINNGKDIETLEKQYRKIQDEFKVRLIAEKKTIAEFWKNLTKILSAQLEMAQNSTVHLEALVEILQKNPRKIQVSEESSVEETASLKETAKPSCPYQPQISTEPTQKVDLPEFNKLNSKSKNIFTRFISTKLSPPRISKRGASSTNE